MVDGHQLLAHARQPLLHNIRTALKSTDPIVSQTLPHPVYSDCSAKKTVHSHALASEWKYILVTLATPHLHAEGAARDVCGAGAAHQDVAAVPVHVHQADVQDADAVHVGHREAGRAHLCTGAS